MFSQDEYLNYTDLNDIEQRIEELTIDLQTKTPIPAFTHKTWALNEFPYIQEIDRIEKAICSMGENYYITEYWQCPTDWIPTGNTSELRKSFDYNDINRWIYNMNIIDSIKDDETTIWNGQSFINWDETTEIDWEE